MGDIKRSSDFHKECYFRIPAGFLAQYSGNPLSEFMVVTHIGYFSKAKYHYCPRKDGINEAVFMYCTEGHGLYSIDGNDNQVVNPGQIIILPPLIPHSYIASDHDPWTIYWMHIKGSIFDSFHKNWSPVLPKSGKSPGRSHAHLVSIPDMTGERIKDIFKQCFSILDMPYQWEDFFYLCQLAATVITLIPRAAKRSVSRLSINGSRGIEAAVSYMKNHLKEAITLEELAASANFSSSYLAQLFREYSSYSPVEYFLRMKIQAAAKDIIFTDLSIREIAEVYGIDDPYYFSRLFKKITGLSPVQYRKNPRGFDIRLDKR